MTMDSKAAIPMLTLQSVPFACQIIGGVTGVATEGFHAGKDIGAGFANLLGGEAKGYTEGVKQALSKSKARCIEQATAIGANLCLGVDGGVKARAMLCST